MKNATSIEDAPTKEPIRPHRLSWGARYCDRYAFSSNRYRNARIYKQGKRRK